MEKKNKLIQGIDTIIVRVSDIERAKAWYQDNLGFSIAWQDDDIKLVVLDTNGATSLTLWQTHKQLVGDKDVSTYPIFKTADARLLRKELQDRSIQVEQLVEDEHVSYFFFFDPDGNVLEACELKH
ncbi:MAG TPA: VOC family protein [Flavisolibacter sp.]|nr:VOC family protein [Flavisolibacter sp.]